MSYALVNPFNTLRLVSDIVSGRAEGGILATFRDWLARRAAYRNTIEELSRLSGRELEDLGIHRCDIPRIARDAVDDIRTGHH
ncbi:MAG: DUF1127 domain-containing protein [Geminicoccaceae bacterium]